MTKVIGAGGTASALAKDRMRVYEQVLTEGTEDDVRRFIDVSELVRLWDDIVLSPHVRAAWRDWLQRNGYL